SQLNLSTQTACANLSAGREFLKACAVGDKRVARVLAFGNGGNVDPSWKLEWHVFQTVDGKIDSSIEQRFIDFFREEALATDLRQRHVQDFVACGFDGNEIDDQGGPPLL